MDAVPRISRAQSLDVLSSMANIAGYRAVVEAAHRFGRFFTGQVTAAGKVPPAKVLVVGAGVAGLAAIGAAGSLGAIVRATDPRPEVADQVKSLGGEYLAVDPAAGEVSATGYAKEMGEDYKAREAQLYAEQAKDVDIIITTALIPGKPAPRIITADMVASMKPGSVIVDMAAANGGNVEGTVKDQAVVTDHGVTIIGYTDLAGRLPATASQLYGTNLVNLLKLLTPEKDGQLTLDFDDVVQRSITVVRDGEVTWPPPPVQVSAAPAAKAEAAPVAQQPAKQPMSTGRRLGTAFAVAAVLFALIALSPAALQVHLTVFALAIVIGYYVIGNVHHALHTPLMSVTNAISGIIVVGALLQIGHGKSRHHRGGLRSHPAGQHQRLRRLRGDPPHAGHVLEELEAMFTLETAATAAYVVAALLFILALAGLSKHETSRAGNTFGIAGMVVALVATIALALARDIEPLGLALLVAAMAIGAAIGLWRAKVVEMTGMPELIALLHSFVGLAAVLVGWNGYLHVERDAGGAEAAAAGQRGHARHPLGRGRHRRVHRRGDVHRLDRRQPQALGAHQVRAADAARQERPQRRRAGGVLRAHGLVRDRPAAVAARRRHGAGAAAGLAPGGLDRRRRHAGGGVDAQQLLGLGRGRIGLPAGQRPADHHRRAGRLLGCVPVLHHVQGDEPVVHLGDRRRLRDREPGRPRTRTTASTARSPPRARPSCSRRRTR